MGLPSANAQRGAGAAVMSREQSEQVRLLGQLVRAEGTGGALVSGKEPAPTRIRCARAASHCVSSVVA